MNKNDVEVLVAYISDMMYLERKKELDPGLISPDLYPLCKAINTLSMYLNELKDFSKDLARGELNSSQTSKENPLCWPLKTLQANLKHLTWQTQQVAQGDYSQRVEFLGDFSRAFNIMIHRLQQREEEYQKQTTEATRMANEFYDMAYQDHDTGLFNRRYCMNLLEEWTTQKLDFTICYVDIDDLKSVNDRLGHMEGDFYIQSFAEVMRKSFRSYDCICRIGGDEFVVLMNSVPKKNAQRRIAQARDSFRQMGRAHGLYEMDFSYGIRWVDCDNTKTPLELLDEADSLMYKAKKEKSNLE